MVLNLIKLNNGGREMEVVTRGKRDRYVFRFPCLFGHCHYKEYVTFLIQSGCYTNSSNGELKNASCTSAKVPYFMKVRFIVVI